MRSSAFTWLGLLDEHSAAVRRPAGDGEILRRFKDNATIHDFNTADLHKQFPVIACLAWVPRLLSYFP